MIGIIGNNKTMEMTYATCDNIEATFKAVMGIDVDLYSDLSNDLQTKYEAVNLNFKIIKK